MKYRKSFVTNSSSSSYVCDICGSDYSGWDAGLSDAGMYQCVNGHTICESHVNFTGEHKIKAIMEYIGTDFDFDYYLSKERFVNKYGKTKEEVIKSITEDEDLEEDFMNNYMEIRYYLPSAFCPLCQFEDITDSDAAKYMFLKFGITAEELRKDIKENFVDYKSFKAKLK